MKKILSFVAVASLLLLTGTMTNAAGKPDHAKGNGPDKEEPPGELVKSVCIDPGHGGDDNPGTSNGVGDNKIIEKDLNLAVAEELQRLLEKEGNFETHMTRTDDSTKSNNDRYTLCNASNATTLISIHHNGSTSNADYPLALYHQRSSEQLANVVGQAVAEEFFPEDPELKTDRFPSGVLIKSDMPSMMSEGYFLTNDKRLEQLETNYEGMVNREAMALLSGITSYYDSN